MKLPYSKHLKRILDKESATLAKTYECTQVKSVHLLLALYRARYTEASKIFQAAVSNENLHYALLQMWGMTSVGPVSAGMRYVHLIPSEPVLTRMEAVAEEMGASLVTPVHLGLALLADQYMRNTLRTAGMESAEIENLRKDLSLHALALSDFDAMPEPDQHAAETLSAARTAPAKASDSPASHNKARSTSRTGSSTPDSSADKRTTSSGWRGRSVSQDSPLRKFATDLTERAHAGKLDPVIGRTKEIEKALEILARKTKRNPLLVGAPGIGKTAIALGLALKIVADGDDLPERLRNKRVFSIEMGDLLAGTEMRGSFEEHLLKAIKEISENGDILFIDEIHTVVGAGMTRGSALDAANMLKTKLANGELSVIGATTWKEYREKFSQDGAMERRFSTIEVNAPSPQEAIEILQGLKKAYEDHHDVKIADSAVAAAVYLSDRYIFEKELPDKAIDLMDEASSKCARSNKRDCEHLPTVEVEHVELIVSQKTGIPLERLREGEKEKLLQLESRVGKRVIGQKHAVKAVSDAIRRARAGVQDPDRPIGSFLFRGPTGVGKTELTRALSEFLFDDDAALLRFDMSEYMEKHSVARLIGAPPGYVGYGGGGLLTEAVRRKRYGVVLFDEIEKAHPDIFNIMLQIMDYGRLTDGQGRACDFRNILLVFTTNCGARELERGGIGFNAAGTNDRSMDQIKNFFSPEFLNRLDEIIPFHKLSRSEVRQIADVQLEKLNALLSNRSIKVELTDSAKDLLAARGWSDEYGARPLKRLIQRLIGTPLADRILAGVIKNGDLIQIAADQEELVFSQTTSTDVAA